MITMSGCVKKNYNEDIISKIERLLEEEIINYKYVVLIPNSGCTGCITTAENFFLENNKNKEIKFIFTYILSKKNLQLRLSSENLSRNNILLDISNKFYLPQYKESIYPIVFFIKEDKVSATGSIESLELELKYNNL